MARMLDESFEMLVMAQHNITRHGGVVAIEVSMHSELSLSLCSGIDSAQALGLSLPVACEVHVQGRQGH
jgi:hypothetical protein